ncbi:MAG TPA: chlorite dismutase family protein [Pyrinomonadaceae bacterium]|jgi:chlorite dismutase
MSLEEIKKNEPAAVLRFGSKRQQHTENAPQIKRQFVNFTFYKARLEWLSLDEAAKQNAITEFAAACEEAHAKAGLIIHSYSLAGLRRNADFMIWRIGYDLDAFQEMTVNLKKTVLGRYLEVTESFLSMTKRSMYIDKYNPEHDEDRLHVIPGKGKYLFVYPFVKTRDWYMRSPEERQTMMDEHIRVGMKYQSVRLHTTYSFGLDDQEFVVAFETDEPQDFLDLVEELRFTSASRYTLRDTPMYSCRQRTLAECLDALG